MSYLEFVWFYLFSKYQNFYFYPAFFSTYIIMLGIDKTSYFGEIKSLFVINSMEKNVKFLFWLGNDSFS